MKNLLLITALATSLWTQNAKAAEYTLMVYETKSELASRTDADKSNTYWSAYNNYAAELIKAGIMRGGSAVDENTVRVVASGKSSEENPNVNDTHLGGYFVIDVPDIETASSWASKIPTQGFVEVRPHRANPMMSMGK